MNEQEFRDTLLERMSVSESASSIYSRTSKLGSSKSKSFETADEYGKSVDVEEEQNSMFSDSEGMAQDGEKSLMSNIVSNVFLKTKKYISTFTAFD